jgi:hypothetical protein
MYCQTNFKTKKALREAVAAGTEVRLFAPGLGEPALNGRETVCGLYYPEPHRWYAEVVVENGIVVKVK